MLDKKILVSILTIYIISMSLIARYFEWDSMIVVFPAVYMVILLVRPIRIKYFIQDALYAIGIGAMYFCLLKNMYTAAYIIMAILLGVAFIWLGIKLYKKYYYGIDPFDE